MGERQKNEGTQKVIVHDLCCWRNRCSSARWPTTNGMSVRECACVRCEGEWGVLSCVVMKEKTNILHHVPHHTFPHWLGLFKSCCQPCLSASLSLRLGLWELLSTVWRRPTASLLRTKSFGGIQSSRTSGVKCSWAWTSWCSSCSWLCQARLRWPRHPGGVPPVKPSPCRLRRLRSWTPPLQASEDSVASTPWAAPWVSDAHRRRVRQGPCAPCWKAGESAATPAASAPPPMLARQVRASHYVSACREVSHTNVGASWFWGCHSSVLSASPVLSLEWGVEKFLQLKCTSY